MAYKKILFCMSALCNESFSLLRSPSLQLQVYLHQREEYYIKSNIKGSATNTSCWTAPPTYAALSREGAAASRCVQNARDARFCTDYSLGENRVAALLPAACHAPSSSRSSQPPRLGSLAEQISQPPVHTQHPHSNMRNYFFSEIHFSTPLQWTSYSVMENLINRILQKYMQTMQINVKWNLSVCLVVPGDTHIPPMLLKGVFFPC